MANKFKTYEVIRNIKLVRMAVNIMIDTGLMETISAEAILNESENISNRLLEYNHKEGAKNENRK